MTDMQGGLSMLSFDGAIHWCFWISVGVFFIGLIWVFLRVLIPLHKLARLTRNLSDDHLPTFDFSVGGIPEIDQLRRSLQQMVEELQASQVREAVFRNALTESQEHERMRIAHEIHDDTIQSLVLVSHDIERAAQTVAVDKDHTDLALHLKHARGQLISAIERLRRLIANLRPAVLDELGLETAFEMLCDEHPLLSFNVVGSTYPIEPLQELALFRTAQEAIHNAERHGQAKHIDATLIYTAAEVSLEVSDDGIGFRVPPQLQELAARGHYGLLGIRERVRHLGGSLHITSQSDHGTHLMVTLPALSQSQPALVPA